MIFRNPLGTISKALVALTLLASFAAGCGGSGAAPTLVSIDVAPATASVAVGATQAFVATAHYSDKTTKNVSTTATWSSSATGTATVSTTGVATGVAAGTAMISAASAGITGSATLTVTSTNPPPPPPTATLTSIVVTPANPMLGVGLTQQFSVTGTYSDATTKDVTAMATWASGTPLTATISASGLATAVAKGTSMITATVGTLNASTTLTVTAPAVLKTIAVTPAAPTIAKGTTVPLIATGSYDDGTTKDLTGTATWASADMTKVTVSAAGVASGVAGGTSMVTATSMGVSGSVTVTVTEAMLVSIAITPDAPTVSVGLKQAFKATGTFKEPTTMATTTQDLTATTTWSSSVATIATIAATGEATGVAVGDTVIKATSGAISGMTTLHVKALSLKSIAVTTTTPSIAKGTAATFVATGTFEDNSTQNLTTQVTWTSTVPGTATVSTAGVATSVGKGTTDITATLNGVMGKVTLTVTDAILKTIAVTAELPAASGNAFAKNTKVQLDAIGTFSDGTKQDLTETVNWTSSMAAITVSNAAGSRGLATAGNAAGMSTLTATVGTGATAISGSLMLTVNNVNLVSIVITPATFSLAAGFTQQFTATGFFNDTSRQDLTETAAWTSDKAATATVSNVAGAKGLAKGLAVGTATLTASIGNANPITATAVLTVSTALPKTLEISPATPNVAMGTTITLSVQGTFTDGSKKDLTDVVTWSSEKTNIATISNATGSNGKVTPVAKGTSNITASYTFAPGQTITGTTLLTVSDALLKSIEVTSTTTTTFEKGTTIQLTATGTFTDGTTANLTKAVTWASNHTNLATVSNTAATAGLVTGVDTGAVTISATSTGPSSTNQPVVDTLDLTINDGKLLSIAVTPATPSIAIGTKLQFVATGTFNDGAKQDITSVVTWSSDAATKATVDAAGLAAGVAEGSANITATKGTGADAIAGTTKLTVKNVTLSSVVVTPNPTAPATNSIAKGTTLQFKATGFFSDTTTQDLTDTATWSAAMPTIVAISNDPATNGLATGAAVGNTTVTATVVIGAKTVASTPVMITVTTQTLKSIAITPAPASVAKGATLNLIATGTYTDDSTQVLTNTVTWSTAAAATATVSNAANQHGRVTGVAVGMVEITATSNAASGSKVAKITVNVTPAAIASINVTVANATVAKTATRQFTATATLTDGTKKDVSATATWASTDMTIATVSSTGLATGVAAGMTQISATQDTIPSNKVTLTVTN